MNNSIKDFLDLEDCDDVIVTDIKVDNEKRVKYIFMEKVQRPMFCPECGCRMHSKGKYVRSVNHPVLNDGYAVILKLSQRKYHCTQEECGIYINEEFSFVEPNKRTSDVTPILILNDLKDIKVTCAKVARMRNVSDTFVHEVVLRYLDFTRLELPEVLCIDEVFLNISNDARYCVILRDFTTGNIIDILPNRYKDTFEDYFLHIPRSERANVVYIVSDMYDPYLKLPEKFFNNAESIIDSFHVISWINSKINIYINEVKKKYQKIDDERRVERNIKENKDFVKRKDSKEVYLLKNHRWVLLMNDDNIDRSPYTRRINQLGGYYSTRQIEEMFMALDPIFPLLKELKEKYIAFNKECVGKLDEAEVRLDSLIEEYKASKYELFRDFGEILKKRKKEIIASFVKLDQNISQEGVTLSYRRMSNGPMEGFNRKPKDMKRDARGFTNFDFLRNRILWAERKDAHILGVPKTSKDVRDRYKSGTKRTEYKKK